MKFEVKSGDSHGYGLCNYNEGFQQKLKNAGIVREEVSWKVYRYFIEIDSLADLLKLSTNLAYSSGKPRRLGIDFTETILYLEISTEVTSNY